MNIIMKKYFKGFLCLFLTLFLVALSFMSFSANNQGQPASTIENIKSRGYIVMSTNADFQPFEYRNGNDIVGIDIEISQKIADKLGVEMRINDTSFDSLVLELKNKNCDFVMAGMSYSEERAKNVEFSDPYFKASQVIVINNNSQITNKDDLNGKRIGVQLGTTGDSFCTSNFSSSNIMRLNKDMDVMSSLMSEKLDAVVIDELCAKRFVERNKDKIKILDQELTSEEYRVAFPKGETQLVNFVNEVISDMKKNGEINSIVEKYNNNMNEKIDVDYSLIIKGLGLTLLITLFALILGVIIATLVSIMKMAAVNNKKLKFLGIIADIYTTVIRGTPALVQLFIMYYIILGFVDGDIRILAAIVSFGINSGAYVAEIIRSGIMSVDKGQIEAGRSLGLTQKTTMIKIVFPQALKNILPSLGNEFITLLKETSVAGFIGVQELTKAGDIIRSLTYEPYIPLLTVAAIYLVMVIGITTLLSKFERRLRKGDMH